MFKPTSSVIVGGAAVMHDPVICNFEATELCDY